jgi:hypothetical protein
MKTHALILPGIFAPFGIIGISRQKKPMRVTGGRHQRSFEPWRKAKKRVNPLFALIWR